MGPVLRAGTLLIVFASACSKAAGVPDASIGAHASAQPTPGSCDPGPNGTGNSKNVGAYCTAGGDQCAEYEGSLLCADDLDPDAGLNVCLIPGCSSHASCGEEACCVVRPGHPTQFGCIPRGCLARDGGSGMCPALPDSGTVSSVGWDGGPHPTPGECQPDPEGTGNSKGVGAYCSSGGSQCASQSFANLCAVELDPRGGNFCIHVPCQDHDQCGEGACCIGMGSPIKACIPAGCVGGICPVEEVDGGSGQDAGPG
jgi:hypothetical protein